MYVNPLADATNMIAIEEIPVLILKFLFVMYVKSGTNITPPPTPNKPESKPPTSPIKNNLNKFYFFNLGKSSLPRSSIVFS